MEKELKLIATHRKARMAYEILETLEAGIALLGSEVKSLRDGRVNFKDSFVRIARGEAFLTGAHIHTYEYAHQFNHAPERDRKLLLHKREIQRLFGKVREKGLTLIPLRLYFRSGRVKLEVGVAKGKKTIDRREDLREREANRDIEKAFKRRY